MQILKGIWFFYQKLLIPSLAVSILISWVAMSCADFYAGLGISFIFLTPAFHYYIYELRNPNEYYFYYNLGLGKVNLWICTILLSTIVGLILLAL